MKKINASRALELVTRLMAVPGKSCEEGEIAGEVVAVLRDAGVLESAISFDNSHKQSPMPGQVGNLIVKLPGSRRKPRLLLSAHLDTVPVCVGSKPTKVGNSIKSADRRTGLGADDRAGVAAVLVSAIEALEESKGELPRPLTLCFFIQEEIGLHGSRNLSVSKLGKPSMALNFDGGDPRKMTIGATSGERIKIKMHGLAAHAGLAPDEGASALTATGLAIAALQKNRWLGAVNKKGKLGTSNIGIIHGGVATNVVADYAEIDVEARSHDSHFRQAIADAIDNAFVEAAAKTRSKLGQPVRAEVFRRVDYDSFRLDENSPAVAAVASVIRQLGEVPLSAISNGGVDANWMVKHGLPTVTIGCGQRDVHTTQESLFVPDFLMACQVGKCMIQQPAIGV